MTKYEYPEQFENLDRTINLWAQLKAETGAAGVTEKVAEINAVIMDKLAELRALPNDPASARRPNRMTWKRIRVLRPAGVAPLLDGAAGGDLPRPAGRRDSGAIRRLCPGFDC